MNRDLRRLKHGKPKGNGEQVNVAVGLYVCVVSDRSLVFKVTRDIGCTVSLVKLVLDSVALLVRYLRILRIDTGHSPYRISDRRSFIAELVVDFIDRRRLVILDYRPP